MASKYRCYLLNGDHITAVQVVEGDDDAAAVLVADRLLASSSYTAAEVWDRDRRVSILSKSNTAA